MKVDLTRIVVQQASCKAEPDAGALAEEWLADVIKACARSADRMTVQRQIVKAVALWDDGRPLAIGVVTPAQDGKQVFFTLVQFPLLPPATIIVVSPDDPENFTSAVQ